MTVDNEGWEWIMRVEDGKWGMRVDNEGDNEVGGWIIGLRVDNEGWIRIMRGIDRMGEEG